MRRAILWIDDNASAVLAYFFLWLAAALMVSMFRTLHADLTWWIYLTSLAYVAGGGAVVVASVIGWWHTVTWAKRPPAIAPRTGDPILEAAKREVEAIAPEES